MPFTQQYLHIIFTTKERRPLIVSQISHEVYHCIYDLCQQKRVFVIRIGGYVDHIHLFVDLPTNLSVAELIQYVKGASSHFIRTHHLIDPWFGWNEGYAVFAVPFDRKEVVKNYIMNQVEHHKVRDFVQEYKMLLDEQHIPFNGMTDIP